MNCPGNLLCNIFVILLHNIDIIQNIIIRTIELFKIYHRPLNAIWEIKCSMNII